MLASASLEIFLVPWARAVGVRDVLATRLEVRDGRWVVYDTLRDSMKIDKTVVPVLTVKRGRVFEPEWGPHPWGWEPERVG